MTDDFTQAMGLSHYTLYMQDYSGTVGFRMVLAHPERVQALIIQDAVAHNKGPGANWKTRRAFWADRAANESARDAPKAQVHIVATAVFELDATADEIAALVREFMKTQK